MDETTTVVESSIKSDEAGVSSSGPSQEKLRQMWEGCVAFEKVKKCLISQGMNPIGDRSVLSGCLWGPLFKITTDNGEKVVEVTFKRGGRGGETGKRYVVQDPSHHRFSAESRLSLLSPKTGAVEVIDWVYNKEMALRALQGIPGIPRLYDAVYEGSKGSILEEYIDGFDLSDILNHITTPSEVKDIFSKIRQTFKAAAKKGFLYNNLAGSTIMVREKDRQPYLMDWHNHIKLDPNSPELKTQVDLQLQELDSLEGAYIVEVERGQLNAVSQKLLALSGA